MFDQKSLSFMKRIRFKCPKFQLQFILTKEWLIQSSKIINFGGLSFKKNQLNIYFKSCCVFMWNKNDEKEVIYHWVVSYIGPVDKVICWWQFPSKNFMRRQKRFETKIKFIRVCLLVFFCFFSHSIGYNGWEENVYARL